MIQGYGWAKEIFLFLPYYLLFRISLFQWAKMSFRWPDKVMPQKMGQVADIDHMSWNLFLYSWALDTCQQKYSSIIQTVGNWERVTSN
jgi:hypothetical protein